MLSLTFGALFPTSSWQRWSYPTHLCDFPPAVIPPIHAGPLSPYAPSGCQSGSVLGRLSRSSSGRLTWLRGPRAGPTWSRVHGSWSLLSQLLHVVGEETVPSSRGLSAPLGGSSSLHQQQLAKDAKTASNWGPGAFRRAELWTDVGFPQAVGPPWPFLSIYRPLLKLLFHAAAATQILGAF